MSLASDIAAYDASVDTRITNKTAPLSISLIDESGCFKDLAALLLLYGFDLTFTVLVNPTITVLWTLLKADSSNYNPNTSTSKNIIVDIGVIAAFTATFQYPVPSGNQSGPTAITGDFGTTDPGPGVASIPLVKANITANETDQVTLIKPKSGYIVVGGQVQQATGNDTTQDSISISFSYKLFSGTTSKDGSGGNPILDSDILALTSAFANSRIASFTNFGGGGQYQIFAFYTGFGTPTFQVNGLTNTAYTKVRSASNFVNAAGFTYQIDVWVSNSISFSPIASVKIL